MFSWWKKTSRSAKAPAPEKYICFILDCQATFATQQEREEHEEKQH